MQEPLQNLALSLAAFSQVLFLLNEMAEASKSAQRSCSLVELVRDDPEVPHPYSYFSLHSRCRFLIKQLCEIKEEYSVAEFCRDIQGVINSHREMRSSLLNYLSEKVDNNDRFDENKANIEKSPDISDFASDQVYLSMYSKLY